MLVTPALPAPTLPTAEAVKAQTAGGGSLLDRGLLAKPQLEINSPA